MGLGEPGAPEEAAGAASGDRARSLKVKKVKVLIIGQGFMGGIAHPRAILEANQQLRARGIELVLSCIAGRDAQRLAETQVRYGFERAATDWKAEIGKADLVVVTTPNREHREMAIAALAAGKAVVCEKPLGASLEDAHEMRSEERRVGKEGRCRWRRK